jgi:hypothetical protein
VTGPLALSIVLKLTAVLTLGLVVLRLAGGLSAAIRHAALVVLFLAAALLPVASMIVPRFDIVLPSSSPSPGAQRSATVPNDPIAPSHPAVASASVQARPASNGMPVAWLLIAAESVGAVLMLLPLTVGLWQTRRLLASGDAWPRGHTLIKRLTRETACAGSGC